MRGPPLPLLPLLAFPIPCLSLFLCRSPLRRHVVGLYVCVRARVVRVYVLVRADVNACWVAVPDAGFI